VPGPLFLLTSVAFKVSALVSPAEGILKLNPESIRSSQCCM
jgi:hypothetical protein